MVQYDANKTGLSNIKFSHYLFLHRRDCINLLDGSVLVCSGKRGKVSKEAVIVSPKSGKIVFIISMQHPRQYHGLCYHQNYVYAFGGKHNSSIISAERYFMVNKI